MPVVLTTGVVLGLLAALAYGTSDFAAGVAGRRLAAGPVAMLVQALGLLAAGIGVLLFPGAGPATDALVWGTVSGVGSALGTLALYRGLAVGQMSVVATCSAVLTAVIPVVVGLVLGEHLSVLAAVGIGIAVPAIGLVSWQRRTSDAPGGRTGLGYGVLAGAGFALLFIALDRAGTHAGAWPLVPGQAASLLIVAPFAIGAPGSRHAWRHTWRSAAVPAVGAGLLSGIANLLFLAATGRGQLTVVAVLTALYPAVTVLLARLLLAERWTRPQAVGLLTAAAAVVLVSIA